MCVLWGGPAALDCIDNEQFSQFERVPNRVGEEYSVKTQEKPRSFKASSVRQVAYTHLGITRQSFRPITSGSRRSPAAPALPVPARLQALPMLWLRHRHTSHKL